MVSPYHINKYTVCIGGEIETEDSREQIIQSNFLPYTNNQPLKYSRSSPRAVVNSVSVLFSLAGNPVKLRLIYIGNVTMRTRAVGPSYHGNAQSAAQPARTGKLWVSKNKLFLDCYKYNDRTTSSCSPDPMFGIASISVGRVEKVSLIITDACRWSLTKNN